MGPKEYALSHLLKSRGEKAVTASIASFRPVFLQAINLDMMPRKVWHSSYQYVDRDPLQVKEYNPDRSLRVCTVT
jgi:hypothetical protein